MLSVAKSSLSHALPQFCPARGKGRRHGNHVRLLPMSKPATTPMRPLGKSLPLKLLRAREAVMDRFRPHLAAHGLTEQQWRVLRALAEAGEMELSALADLICLLPPSLSRIIPDLDSRGLVARRRADADRRTTLVGLTREGRVLFETMSRRSEAIYRDLEAALAAAGCAAILDDLDRLIEALSARAPQVPPAPAQTSRPRLQKV